MLRKLATYSLILGLLVLIGCAKDEFPQTPEITEPVSELKLPERAFNIFASFPEEVGTRATVINEDKLNRCWATAFNHENKNLGKLPSEPYFQHEEFDKNGDRFMPKHEEKCKAPVEGGLFEFFASYPSAEEMSDSCGVKYAGINNHDPNDKEKHNGYFTIDNKSESLQDSTLKKIDYSIANFKIASDIAKQVDFLTARSTQKEDIPEVKFIVDEEQQGGGNSFKYENISVELDFEHQLSNIEIQVWGNNGTYVYEIAGVRIGNANVEGKFRFNTLADFKRAKKPNNQPDPEFVGSWNFEDNANLETKGKGVVEYIYRPGDKIVKLDGTANNTKTKPATIMGKSNFAMVLPGKNDKWVRPAVPADVVGPYSTTQAYFSVLMRVRHNVKKYGNDKMVYPYPIHPDEHINGNMKVVWLAVKDADATVVARVYPGVNANEYYSDEKKTIPYTITAGVTVKDFGWAAAPVAFNWEQGKKYAYKLNYTNGIGVHDPSDPHPGTPIMEQNAAEVTFDVEVTPWGDFKDEEPIKVIPDPEN